MQYTLRNIPEVLDHALRERAKREGKSLNEVAIDALSRALGVSGYPVKYRDLKDIAGSWEQDSELETALDEQRKIDDELWK